MPLPLNLLIKHLTGLIRVRELLRRMLEIRQHLQLRVQRRRGGDVALHFPNRGLHLFGGEEEVIDVDGGGVYPTRQEVGVDVLESDEGRVGAVTASEAGNGGGDAVEVVELLEEGEGEEKGVVLRDKGADGSGG